MQYYLAAIDIDPGYVRARFNLAVANMNTGVRALVRASTRARQLTCTRPSAAIRGRRAPPLDGALGPGGRFGARQCVHAFSSLPRGVADPAHARSQLSSRRRSTLPASATRSGTRSRSLSSSASLSHALGARRYRADDLLLTVRAACSGATCRRSRRVGTCAGCCRRLRRTGSLCVSLCVVASSVFHRLQGEREREGPRAASHLRVGARRGRRRASSWQDLGRPHSLAASPDPHTPRWNRKP